jgi:aminopeptidase N
VGINTISFDVQSGSSTPGAAIESADAVQSASPSQPTIRPHRLGVGLYDWLEGRLQRRRGFEIDIDSERTPIAELIGESRPPLLLPNDGALTYAKVRLDPVSLATVQDHLGEIADPLARAIIWDALQDMVRDAEFPASRYVRVVARHLARETDESLIPVVLASARRALARYGARSAGDRLEDELAQACAAALESTAPGSSQQLSWLRAVISSAITEEQLGRCREMLSGHDLPEGVVLDLELRWRLLTALATRGAAGLEEISGMRRADPTSTGVVRGLAAQAAMPSPEAKEKVFKFLTEDSSATVEAALWAGSSFGGVRQDDLLLPYIPRFFAAVNRLREQRGVEYSRDFAYWSIGSLPPHPDLVAAITAELSRANLDPDLRRIYQEALEEAEMAMRARAVDEREVGGEAT